MKKRLMVIVCDFPEEEVTPSVVISEAAGITPTVMAPFPASLRNWAFPGLCRNAKSVT